MPVRLVLCLCLLSPVAPGAAEVEDPPSLELLEYLGEWQDAEGNAIDPQELKMLSGTVVAGGGEKDEDK